MILGVISLKKGVPKRGKNRHPRNTVLRFTLKIRGSAPEPILGVCGFGLLSVNIGTGSLGGSGHTEPLVASCIEPLAG